MGTFLDVVLNDETGSVKMYGLASARFKIGLVFLIRYANRYSVLAGFCETAAKNRRWLVV